MPDSCRPKCIANYQIWHQISGQIHSPVYLFFNQIVPGLNLDFSNFIFYFISANFFMWQLVFKQHLTFEKLFFLK